jgi:timeless
MCVFSFVTVNLKNLQRFLRRDDPESRDIFMQLGKWNTIRQDILPIIISYRDQFDLVLNAGECSNSSSVGSS